MDESSRLPMAPQLQEPIAGDDALHLVERVTTEVGRHLGRIRAQLDELDGAILETSGLAQEAIRNHLRVGRAAIEAGELIAMRIEELRAMIKVV